MNHWNPRSWPGLGLMMVTAGVACGRTGFEPWPTRASGDGRAAASGDSTAAGDIRPGDSIGVTDPSPSDIEPGDPGPTFGLSYDFTTGSLTPTIGSQPMTFTRPDVAPVATHYGPDGKLRRAPHNLVTHSEALSDDSWGKHPAATVTADTDIAPDGTLTADTITLSDPGSFAQVFGWVPPSVKYVTKYTFSIWMKGQNSVRIGGNCIVETEPAQALTAAWTRYEFTMTTQAGPCSIFPRILLYPGDGPVTFQAWGAQFEENLTASATYLPTTSAPRYDGPRFNHDAGTLAPRGMLFEEPRTNLALRSEELDAAAVWNAWNVTVTADSAPAPDGNQSADRLNETAVSDNRYIRQTLTKAAASLPYTFSVFVKAGSRRFVEMRLDDANGGILSRFNAETGASLDNVVFGTGWTFISAQSEYAGNGWYRLSFSATSSAAASITLNVGPMADFQTDNYPGAPTENIYVWGAQLEQAKFGTSYMPTEDVAVSRAIERATFAGGAWYNAAAGTWLLDYSQDRMMPQPTDPNEVFAGFEGADHYEYATVPFAQAPATSEASLFFYSQAAGVETRLGSPWTGISTRERHIVGFTVTPGDVWTVLDGGTVQGPVAATLPVPTLFYLGATDWDGWYFTGHLRQVEFLGTAYASSELVAATVVPTGGFTDNFDDNVIGAEWCVSSTCSHLQWATDPLVTVAEVGGRFAVDVSCPVCLYNGLVTSRPYYFWGARMTVELVVPPVDGGPEAGIAIDFARERTVEMYKKGTDLIYSYHGVSGLWVYAAPSVPYDLVAHRWLRILHDPSDDSIDYQTSPDGQTWTTRGSVSQALLGARKDTAYLSLYGGDGEGPTTAVEFDNFSTTATKN